MLPVLGEISFIFFAYSNYSTNSVHHYYNTNSMYEVRFSLVFCLFISTTVLKVCMQHCTVFAYILVQKPDGNYSGHD